MSANLSIGLVGRRMGAAVPTIRYDGQISLLPIAPGPGASRPAERAMLLGHRRGAGALR